MVREDLSGRGTSELRLEQCDKTPIRAYGKKLFRKREQQKVSKLFDVYQEGEQRQCGYAQCREWDEVTCILFLKAATLDVKGSDRV